MAIRKNAKIMRLENLALSFNTVSLYVLVHITYSISSSTRSGSLPSWSMKLLKMRMFRDSSKLRPSGAHCIGRERERGREVRGKERGGRERGREVRGKEREGGA